MSIENELSAWLDKNQVKSSNGRNAVWGGSYLFEQATAWYGHAFSYYQRYMSHNDACWSRNTRYGPYPGDNYKVVAMFAPGGHERAGQKGNVCIYFDDKKVLRHHTGQFLYGMNLTKELTDPEATEESLTKLLEQHVSSKDFLYWWQRQFKLIIELCKKKGYFSKKEEKEVVAS